MLWLKSNLLAQGLPGPRQASKRALSQKEQGRKEDEKGNHFCKHLVAGAREEDPSEQAAHQAHSAKSFEPWTHRRDLGAKAINAAEVAKYQRQGAGGVSNNLVGPHQN